MDQLLQILEETFPDIDFTGQTALVTDGILDSLSIVTLISQIEDAFDISITMEYIQPAYFESVEKMWEMIEELQ